MTVMLHRAQMFLSVMCVLASVAKGADDPRVSLAIARNRVSVPRPDFRIESDLVLIPVRVTDSRSHAVTGLGRDSFRLFEDNQEQRISQFAYEDAAISVGILFDTSGSMMDKLPQCREAVRQFLRFANEDDEFFLVEFNRRAELTVPFTNQTGDIENALLLVNPKGTTAFLDAVGLALNTLKQARHPRRALLILSDGGDNHSRYSRREIVERIRESDVAIYALGLYSLNALITQDEIDAGRVLLERLALVSGGRHIAMNGLTDLPVTAARISLELRNQYLLGYRPANSTADGKYHRVRVNVTAGQRLTLSYRPGYYRTQ